MRTEKLRERMTMLELDLAIVDCDMKLMGYKMSYNLQERYRLLGLLEATGAELRLSRIVDLCLTGK